MVKVRGKRTSGPCVRVYSEAPRPLPKNQLPLWRDVDLAIEDAKDNEHLSQKDAVVKVTNEIIEIYKKVNITTINELKIKQKVEKVLELRRNTIKNLSEKKSTGKVRDQGKWRQKKKKNKVKLCDVQNELFEIKKAVPDIKQDQDFYLDQKTERKLFIAGLTNCTICTICTYSTEMCTIVL